ncbi:MAG: chorismate synthase [Calditrichaeota bacterium]|nr:MAG: chorismate synthase [Calditrichota bacterium]
MLLRYLTAGESHGQGLIGILEGIPAGLELTAEDINTELALRQQGYGRSNRQKIETDKIKIYSGVRHGKTIGSPISLILENKDFANWQEVMSPEENKNSEKKVLVPRPGHADLNGVLKFGFSDARNVLERSSARETAMRTAVGAICKKFLSEFGIQIETEVLSIGGVSGEKNTKAKIDEAKEQGFTLGGKIKVVAKNVPVGLGSYVHWDKKLDARLAFQLTSIQAIKAVEFGLGTKIAELKGSEVHDEIFWGKEEGFYRKSNNSGGIEGGMSTGSDIEVTLSMKPIPTLMKPLNSVNLETKEVAFSHRERSDITAVFACSIIAKNLTAFVLAQAFLEKFGGDSVSETKRNFDSYVKEVNNF